ncbi:MAG: GNAT family N-acetyltransferase [Anaerolineae bacterium]|nr:GNAT family N-acetyltransferase [Anaerolineae bacterium]
MDIRLAKTSDSRPVAELHQRLLDQSFLGSLGCGFLNNLYRALAEYDRGILLIAEAEGLMVGFIAGVYHTGDFYKYFLRRHFIVASLAILPKAFNVHVLKRLWETATYSRKEETVPDAPHAELLSMAVVGEQHGTGVARHLFEQLTEEFTRRGIDQFKIVAGAELHRANAFYRKMGCHELGEMEVHAGDQSIIYLFGDRQTGNPQDWNQGA